MPTKHHNFIVIGGGSGGYAAARTALNHGKQVAIIDGAETLGGLCILRGCMPSKTLIYSAEVLHLARKAETFGLHIPEAKVDMPALHHRKLETIAEFAEYRQQQLNSDRFTLYRSHAHFIDSHTLRLDDGTELTADKIVIGTGSQVNTPDIPGLLDSRVWNSDHVLELDHVPASVLVLGGGIVACELAQFLARIGTQVTLIQRSARILKEHSPEASAVIESAFRSEGIEVITDTQLESIDWSDDGVTVHFKKDGTHTTRTAAHLFNALGRKPATADLGLENAGITLRPSGHIETNAYLQTSQPDVYAVGDCAGPHEIVHVAILQGECAANHACGQPADPVDYRTLTGVVFTDPQIAHVGMTQAQMDAEGIPYLCADYPFDDHGKSILMDAKHGYVKIWGKRGSGQILAAECVGKDASELIHALAVAVTLKATVHDILKVHWYHPTLAEIWSYPIEEVRDGL